MEAEVDENYEKYMADVGSEHLAKIREQKAIETKDTEAKIWEILGACKDIDIEVEELLLLCKGEHKAGEDKGKQEGFDKAVEWLKTKGYRVTQTKHGDVTFDFNDTTARADLFKFTILPEEFEAFLKERGK